MTHKQLYLFTSIMVMALVLAACGGGGSSEVNEAPADTPELAGEAVAGEALFQQSCSACHGPDAKGLPNLGKNLTTSDFVADNSNSELLQFVKTGRPVGDPANTTGIDMPPKGGNPALTDEQILDIIAYIRTLHE